jgi:hypothetical protein
MFAAGREVAVIKIKMPAVKTAPRRTAPVQGEGALFGQTDKSMRGILIPISFKKGNRNL